jgi:hypothetical protein
MPNCVCTWSPNPAPADFGPNDIKYNQTTEILTVKMTVNGTAQTTIGQGHHDVKGRAKLSAYEWGGTRWHRLHKGNFIPFATVQINCGDDKAANSPYEASIEDKFDVDAAHIAGRQRLILLQVYFEAPVIVELPGLTT